MASPLYSPGPIQPAVDLYDYAVLIGAAGPLSGDGASVKQVVGIEPIPSLGLHGVILVWTAATPAAAPAGYQVYGGEAAGALAIGGQVQGAPNVLQLATNQVLHFRMSMRVIGALPAGVAAGDLDLQVNQPASNGRWSLPGVRGVWNQAIQVPLPGDTAVGPAQGADQAVPTAYPSEESFSPSTEILCAYQNSPQFIIVNHGSAAIPATSGVAVGVVVRGFRYDLIDVAGPDPSWSVRSLGDTKLSLPPFVKFLPVASRVSQGIQ